MSDQKQSNHTERQFDILEHQLQVLKRRFIIIAGLFVGLGMLNVAFLILVQFNQFKPQSAQQVGLNQLEIKPLIRKDYQTSIKTFYNNAAISEVAYQLELKRQSISTVGTTNCFTPEVPSPQNGCSFVVRPYASGIRNKASFLSKMVFNVQMGSQDKIAVDIRNTDKNEVEKSLGVIEGRSAVREIKLPAQLEANQQLYIRLWPVRGSNVTLNEILIDYLSSERFEAVELVLPKAFPTKQATVYMDYNNNKAFDPLLDQIWNCTNGFAGVETVVLGNETSLKLKRTDSCMKSVVPTSWGTDGGASALPPYNWLLLLQDTANQTTVFPFEVERGKNSYQLGT